MEVEIADTAPVLIRYRYRNRIWMAVSKNGASVALGYFSSARSWMEYRTGMRMAKISCS